MENKYYKVCHLTSVHPIDDVRIFTKECTSLAQNGFDVTLIAFGDSAREDIKNGINRISLHVPVKNRLQRMIKRTKTIYKRALQVNADIYHIHDPELLTIALKLKKNGKIVIFDSHEFYGEAIRGYQYIPPVLRNIVASIYMRYETYVCKRIDAVIQVCMLDGKDYFKNRAARAVFITNAAILEELILGDVISFNDRKSVAYIGVLSYNRGITHLVKAVAGTDARLILAGKFSSENYKNEIMHSAESSVIDFRGYLDKNGIENVLKTCFAGVSTLLQLGQFSKIDTLPTKVYEYMTIGLPVIISDTKFAKAMIGKYEFGIVVNPTNSEEIGNAVNFLYQNPAIAQKMGENGRIAIQSEFNWQKEEIKLIQLYNSLLN